MCKPRLSLSDRQWALMAPILDGKRSDPGRTGTDNRLFVEAVLWIVRAGAAWRDLPAIFGNWNTAYVRFSRWSKDGVWNRLFDEMREDSDFKYTLLDSSIVWTGQATDQRTEC